MIKQYKVLMLCSGNVASNFGVNEQKSFKNFLIGLPSIGSNDANLYLGMGKTMSDIDQRIVNLGLNRNKTVNEHVEKFAEYNAMMTSIVAQLEAIAGANHLPEIETIFYC